MAPVLRPLPVDVTRSRAVLGGTDVLLVTGDGQGMTVECALVIATDSGARLALVGRSDPTTDAELAANLTRIRAAGVTVGYAHADVTDPAQVRAAVVALTEQLGPVTAVLHGPGRNDRATTVPAVDGLRTIVDAVDIGRLRLLAMVGSTIGRTGRRGEAQHATAIAWLSAFAEEHPACRTLCLEWENVTPERGLTVLRRVLADPQAPVVVVVRGLHTAARDEPELPPARFVDRLLVHHPGVELVTEVDLDTVSDPYLAEHQLYGNLIFPAVLGMEAMAQVAAALTGWTRPPLIENAEFTRPIMVPQNGSTTVRVAAVRTSESTVDVVIRSAETAFTVVHARATLRRVDRAPCAGPPEQLDDGLPPVRLDPATELYGDVTFQGRRFQRLRRYNRASAREVDATVAVLPDTRWFASCLPQRLILGDPGVRDALMHGIQVCVPDRTLLPVRVDTVHTVPGGLARPGQLRYCATERSRDGDTYVYDVVLRGADGAVVERWTGLHLRAVRRRGARRPWAAPLLGSYLERTLGDLTGGAVEVVVEPDDPADGSLGHVAACRARTTRAVSRLLGGPVQVHYRPDGRPEANGDKDISAAHGGGLTVCVAATGVVACDVRQIGTPGGRDSLGQYHEMAATVARATGEPLDTAATRVSTAIECLRKAGAGADAPLALRPVERKGWTVFASRSLRIGVLATAIRGHDTPMAFAVLLEESQQGTTRQAPA